MGECVIGVCTLFLPTARTRPCMHTHRKQQRNECVCECGSIRDTQSWADDHAAESHNQLDKHTFSHLIIPSRTACMAAMVRGDSRCAAGTKEQNCACTNGKKCLRECTHFLLLVSAWKKGFESRSSSCGTRRESVRMRVGLRNGLLLGVGRGGKRDTDHDGGSLPDV